MSVPGILVEVGLDLSSVGGPFFLFGSSSDAASNPQSIFDNSTYRLGGTLFYDVTEKVQSVTINRGRSRELDRFTTGSANILFTNQDRAFDPFYTSSPYYPDIKPRRSVRVSTIVAGASSSVQFTGLVEDWTLDYQVSGESDANASCVDGFVLFGGQQLSAHTATPQYSGERVAAILDRPEVAWPATLRNLSTGGQLFQADVIEGGRDVLEYLQVVEASEPGFLYMSKNNSVTFRDRNAAAALGTIVFSDAGTAIDYTDLTVSYGTELLYNRASVAFIGGDSQVASNPTSISEYGVVALDLNGLLFREGAAGSADAAALANYIVNKYANPELRFDSVSVELAGMGTANQTKVLSVELQDNIIVEYQPNRIGSRISKNMQVLGVSHRIAPKSHKVTFNLGSTDTAAFVFAAGTAVADYPFSVFDSTAFGL